MRTYIFAVLLVFFSAGVFYGENAIVRQTATAGESNDDEVDVPVTRYRARALIDTEWGTGSGEFNYRYGKDRKGKEVEYCPESLALNSRSDIYVLDTVNNRIKKYSRNGKYLLGIPVPSFMSRQGKPFDEDKPIADADVFYRGCAVAIDAANNLYYYFTKGDKGVVWQFKNDEKVKQWIFPVPGAKDRLRIDGDNAVWIGDYNVADEKQGAFDRDTIKGKKALLKVDRSRAAAGELKLTMMDRKNEVIMEISYKGSKQGRYADIYPVVKNDDIFVWKILNEKGKRRAIVDLYDLRGTLVSSMEVPDSTIDPESSPMDVSGNIFQLQNNIEGLRVVRWE